MALAAARFKALSDPTRLRILELLRRGENCACILLEDLPSTQSGLSYHMKILCEAGLVGSRQKGKWIYYSLRPEGFADAEQFLHELGTLMPENPEIKSRQTELCGCIKPDVPARPHLDGE
ncbi:MAG: metalloregulator ArsR/SmtB family transcription factor [Clostridiales bacterium]|nr:metalloregulator ArsR/SmtB family transcription factor [Clostridiales bacterium]MDD7432880.1 metalloregulator ArsR/SmtB family transcription factor [Clostridiales bacterium]MDY3061573.1 metalloregulator ArsR/SmtB family transcription factor [Eubacteriales bacterium]